MKKIFYFLMAAFMFIGIAANAQTVENNGVFSHMYIGINGGANLSNLHDVFCERPDFKSMTYNAFVELGKDVTPITGFSLQAGVAPIYHNVANGENVYGEWKINRTDLIGNTKFNLMNLFGGYKGYPRRVEIKTVTGIGWNHYFEGPNPNDIALQGGLEFDFNLGKNRNWYITFNPMVQANNVIYGNNHIIDAFKNADLRANLGVSYRFGRGNTSHNFTICDKVYTEEEYNELYSMFDDCMSTANRVDTVVVEKIVKEVVEKVVVKPYDTFIIFKIGSSNITKDNMNTINAFAEYAIENGYNVKVIGSADTGTGKKDFNEQLAFDRAKKVAEVLINAGVKNVSFETSLDIDEDAESSRCAVIIAE